MTAKDYVPERHSKIDPRATDIANRLIERFGGLDVLLPTDELAEYLGVSTQWVEIGRVRGYGPRFVRLSPTLVRYRVDAVVEWLREREHASTREYRTKAVKRRSTGRPKKAQAA